MRKPDRINYEFDYVLGQVLKEKRKSKGYSLQNVADKLKTTKQAIFLHILWSRCGLEKRKYEK